MKKLNPLLIIFSVLIVTAIVVPALLVLPFSSDEVRGRLDEQIPKEEKKENEQDIGPAIEVAVYRSQQKQVETLPLEDYVAGVVAAEMPADFEKEALKAQALAARTYIVKMINGGDTGKVEGQADVTDTVQHQVYKSKQELKQLWGKDFEWKSKKIDEAVKETAGQILTYNGEPITASFFSTSNGYTENSEDYWDEPVPYLRSVESPWDRQSPKFESKMSLSLKEFESKLGVKIKGGSEAGVITERTTGKRIGKVKIGGKEFTGREVREKLGLHSADFSWMVKGNEIVIAMKGYGHGVGMSQYGANGMAKSGKNYQDIVYHYYQNVKIENANNVDGLNVARK
ncbi:MAG TPA: stage II sporulation protein D [Chondromyces sp.]|nr:stage II sporulation protein D [Chondromyces sp.]